MSCLDAFVDADVSAVCTSVKVLSECLDVVVAAAVSVGSGLVVWSGLVLLAGEFAELFA